MLIISQSNGKIFQNTQIDSHNKTKITFNHIKELLFNDFDLI